MDMGKAKKKKSVNSSLVILAVLCVVIVALGAFTAYLVHRNNEMKSMNSNAENSLSAAQSELFSLEEALSQKQREAESFSQAFDEQSSAFESEKNALNEKIADLNKQIALKRQREEASRAAAAAALNPGSAHGNPASNPTPSSNGKIVYLTFDDGPSSNTPRILDILDAYGVKATFFVINGGKYNHYMADIVNRGHAIALHSYTHDYKKIYSSDEAFYNDLQAISDLVFSQTGVRSNITRFPGGASNTVSRKYNSGIMSRLTQGVLNKGYHYFDWNLSSGDASGNNIPKDTIVANCKRLPKSNTVIVLMHDTRAKGTTVEALPEIIEYYKSAGCGFDVITSSTPPVRQKVNN
ncbi:MAG TPA: hypothetical protein DCR23_06995 [Ruminococcaceae bacterium]|nr:hypothetical protein [Oscillospiraceae bacterium]